MPELTSLLLAVGSMELDHYLLYYLQAKNYQNILELNEFGTLVNITNVKSNTANFINSLCFCDELVSAVPMPNELSLLDIIHSYIAVFKYPGEKVINLACYIQNVSNSAEATKTFKIIII